MLFFLMWGLDEPLVPENLRTEATSEIQNNTKPRECCCYSWWRSLFGKKTDAQKDPIPQEMTVEPEELSMNQHDRMQTPRSIPEMISMEDSEPSHRSAAETTDSLELIGSDPTTKSDESDGFEIVPDMKTPR